jgi:hypothetical protein
MHTKLAGVHGCTESAAIAAPIALYRARPVCCCRLTSLSAYSAAMTFFSASNRTATRCSTASSKVAGFCMCKTEAGRQLLLGQQGLGASRLSNDTLNCAAQDPAHPTHPPTLASCSCLRLSASSASLAAASAAAVAAAAASASAASLAAASWAAATAANSAFHSSSDSASTKLGTMAVSTCSRRQTACQPLSGKGAPLLSMSYQPCKVLPYVQ